MIIKALSITLVIFMVSSSCISPSYFSTDFPLEMENLEFEETFSVDDTENLTPLYTHSQFKVSEKGSLIASAIYESRLFHYQNPHQKIFTPPPENF